MPRVFLVTGCSTGFGKHLIEEILAKGDIAVATARNPYAYMPRSCSYFPLTHSTLLSRA